MQIRNKSSLALKLTIQPSRCIYEKTNTTFCSNSVLSFFLIHFEKIESVNFLDRSFAAVNAAIAGISAACALRSFKFILNPQASSECIKFVHKDAHRASEQVRFREIRNRESKKLIFFTVLSLRFATITYKILFHKNELN